MSKTSNWRKNKAKAIYINTEPTMTDQAAAKDTDINVIVKQFGVHGQMPRGPKDPIYGDFTGMPESLRDAVEMARKANYHKRSLPPQLADLSIEELLALTPDTLKAKLATADKPADDKKDETK